MLSQRLFIMLSATLLYASPVLAGSLNQPAAVPVESEALPRVGGYSALDPAAEENQHVRLAAEQALQAKYPDANLQLIRMTKLEVQVVAGLNYRLTADYASDQGEGEVMVSLYRDLKGKYTLTKENFGS